jgi:uncharacterized protein with FMN-binding domain
MNLNAGKPYRARLGLAGLLGAAVLVVTGKAAVGHDAPAAAVVSLPGATAGASESSSNASQSPAAVSTQTTPAATTTAAGPSSAQSSGTRTVVGDVEDTRYGTVQVKLVLNGRTITDVVVLQVPNRERRDVEINDQAVPILRQEVLAAQSAKIDAVSGASFTSSGYAWSVQSAIDKAGL